MRNPTLTAATRQCESKLDVALRTLDKIDVLLTKMVKDSVRPSAVQLMEIYDDVKATIELCKREEVT